MYYIGHVTWPFLRPLSYRKAISESAIPLLSTSSVHEAIPIHSLEMGQTKFFSAGVGLVTLPRALFIWSVNFSKSSSFAGWQIWKTFGISGVIQQSEQNSIQDVIQACLSHKQTIQTSSNAIQEKNLEVYSQKTVQER